LAAIVASSDDAIVSKNLDGIIESWNAAAERIFGYTAEEMIGKPIALLVPSDRPDEEPGILARLRRGERVDHFQTVRVRKDGKLIDVSVTISPIKDASGAIIGASKIARDITELKQLMIEREQLLDGERAARSEAERVSRVKDEFLATLSHELRTPLNAILGWSQLLRSGAIPARDFGEALETIERNSRIQAQLIEELLDVSRIISGKLRLDVQPIDLASIVDGVVESMRPAADAKEIRLQRTLDPTAGPVMGDANRIQQVVWNLLSNAIKFTPKGGRVQVLLQRVASSVQITVTDSGQGVPPEYIPQLFQRFWQADASTTRKHGGLGLGLAIVRHLVEVHGGTVHASSEGVGKGATFTVTLPLSSVKRSSDQSCSAQSTIPLDLQGVRVLVVDDEMDARNLIKLVLESHGATVTLAESADQAMSAIKQQKQDVVLSDIGMPGEDGYSLLARMRNLGADEGRDTPAVALTAFARAEDRRRALLAGFQMHVPKPVEAGELIAVVANLSKMTRKSTT
jgi:PAS domain S-box-containing protein